MSTETGTVEVSNADNSTNDHDPRSHDCSATPTIDIPLESLTTYKLLELCPPGYLPRCVTNHTINSPSSPLPLLAATGEWRNKTELATAMLPPYPVGTRFRFHFQTTITKSDELVDDTRQQGLRPRPLELITGRGFVLEIWEVALNTMRENQVVRFEVPKELCVQYPTVAKVKRDLSESRNGDIREIIVEGTGYPDLDTLLISPQNLTFSLELLEVSLPEEYNPPLLYRSPDKTFDVESQINDPLPNSNTNGDDSATLLEGKADKLLISRDYFGAAAKYTEALDLLNQLIVSPETEGQRKKKVSLLMKAAYCRLNSKQFEESLELLTSVLELSPNNPVALFRRGRCNVQTGRFDQARRDFARALELDPTYQKAVKPELAAMDSEERKLNR